MNLTDDNEALCRTLLRLAAQIKSGQVSVESSTITRTVMARGQGVAYQIMVHILEKDPMHIPTPIAVPDPENPGQFTKSGRTPLLDHAIDLQRDAGNSDADGEAPRRFSRKESER